jgi:hypothetical protein
VLRGAWTNTIARPNYYDLVPYRIVSNEDMTLDTGNPDLDATTSMNFDLMVERYFRHRVRVRRRVLQGHQRLHLHLHPRNALDPVTGRPSRGSPAAERRQRRPLRTRGRVPAALDFLPGHSAGLGLYTNYTFTESSVKGLNVDGRGSGGPALPGSAQHTANSRCPTTTAVWACAAH